MVRAGVGVRDEEDGLDKCLEFVTSAWGSDACNAYGNEG